MRHPFWAGCTVTRRSGVGSSVLVCMAQSDNLKTRPFTRTRWWGARQPPVRPHGGQLYGQADPACDCSDEAVLRRVAEVWREGAVGVPSHLGRARRTAEALWRSGYL